MTAPKISGNIIRSECHDPALVTLIFDLEITFDLELVKVVKRSRSSEGQMSWVKGQGHGLWQRSSTNQPVNSKISVEYHNFP